MFNAPLLHILQHGSEEFGSIYLTVLESRAEPFIFASANETLDTAVGTYIRMPGMSAGPPSLATGPPFLKPVRRIGLLLFTQPHNQLLLQKVTLFRSIRVHNAFDMLVKFLPQFIRRAMDWMSAKFLPIMSVLFHNGSGMRSTSVIQQFEYAPDKITRSVLVVT